MRHLCIVALLVGVAHANRIRARPDEPPPQEAGAWIHIWSARDASVDRISLDLRGDETSVRATLQFRVMTKLREADDVRVPIELSPGIAVTGFSYALGKQPAIVAVARSAEEALDLYTTIVGDQKDPALLRMLARSPWREVLELRVFPVTRRMPATVTIEMTLPRVPRVQLEVAPSGELKSFELPAVRETWMSSDPTKPRQRVDATTSLFAGDKPLRKPVLARREQHLPTVTRSDRHEGSRSAIPERAPQLQRCFTFGAPSGQTCVAETVARWQLLVLN